VQTKVAWGRLNDEPQRFIGRAAAVERGGRAVIDSVTRASRYGGGWDEQIPRDGAGCVIPTEHIGLEVATLGAGLPSITDGARWMARCEGRRGSDLLKGGRR